MADKRESNRVKAANHQKCLDEAARIRRRKKALAALERDNFHEDPHADLDLSQSGPKFDDAFIRRRKKKLSTEPFKQRFRRNFAALLEDEEDYFTPGCVNYISAQVGPSQYPPRHFCAVCGFPANYTCVQCGARFCCIKCSTIHRDTRCLKWTA